MMDMDSTYIRRQDVKDHFSFLTKNILKHWADAGKGPSYIRFGRDALYRPEDIQDYLNQIGEKPDLEERKKRKVVAAILEGSPARKRPGRPKKQPTAA